MLTDLLRESHGYFPKTFPLPPEETCQIITVRNRKTLFFSYVKCCLNSLLVLLYALFLSFFNVIFFNKWLLLEKHIRKKNT